MNCPLPHECVLTFVRKDEPYETTGLYTCTRDFIFDTGSSADFSDAQI